MCRAQSPVPMGPVPRAGGWSTVPYLPPLPSPCVGRVGSHKGRLGPWEAGCGVGTVALEAVTGGAGCVPNPGFSVR